MIMRLLYRFEVAALTWMVYDILLTFQDEVCYNSFLSRFEVVHISTSIVLQVHMVWRSA